MTDDLRQRIDDAIRPTMLLGLQGAELFDAPGAERIGEWADWISKTVTELLTPELEELRTRCAKAERAVDLLAEAHRQAEQAEASREEPASNSE
ncbi:hypothetical protein [Streptomyces lydicus]|uniref:hypothetical protein n=1 Tax=Streptomyces lydicus TaxID=47763 RepID=UPI0037977AF9